LFDKIDSEDKKIVNKSKKVDLNKTSTEEEPQKEDKTNPPSFKQINLRKKKKNLKSHSDNSFDLD